MGRQQVKLWLNCSQMAKLNTWISVYWQLIARTGDNLIDQSHEKMTMGEVVSNKYHLTILVH